MRNCTWNVFVLFDLQQKGKQVGNRALTGLLWRKFWNYQKPSIFIIPFSTLGPCRPQETARARGTAPATSARTLVRVKVLIWVQFLSRTFSMWPLVEVSWLMEVLVRELRWLWSSTLTALCSGRMTAPGGGLASGSWGGRVQPTCCWHDYFPALSRKDWWRIGWSPHFICDPRHKDRVCVSWLFCFVCFVWWSRTQLVSG